MIVIQVISQKGTHTLNFDDVSLMCRRHPFEYTKWCVYAIDKHKRTYCMGVYNNEVDARYVIEQAEEANKEMKCEFHM